MTNDENQKKPEFRMTNGTANSSVLRTSSFVILSSFGIRHLAFAALCLLSASAATPPANSDYSAVDAVFNAHCLDCHAATEPEGQLVLEHFETLMKGGELGPALVPGKSADSLLVQMIEGRFEKEGKKKSCRPASGRS